MQGPSRRSPRGAPDEGPWKPAGPSAPPEEVVVAQERVVVVRSIGYGDETAPSCRCDEAWRKRQRTSSSSGQSS
jgi:hypothetical protein